ncbi:uncharacterized protein PHACADRAFT_248877 [Phanerochaete carnosa HHB-10118-sp]|uniref:C2H2-type domain-containing protein n=1 Tax=Phanerochaete carnosa (strain HHB-10118-sp) TaxID=650164 RepID=K5WI85_PHACS|nr:uncharacterized protein PHACADRAFT_248877 [Phanerochaete carnosa HHB-10118-sp]EKM58789.1 hypothetical protein PHACADRAFT_248877 [Phanerochaete carnosa HHB-10118-sp]
MLGPLYTDRDRSPSTQVRLPSDRLPLSMLTDVQAHEPQQALRPHDPGYAPHPSVSPDSAYDATPAPAPPRSRPSFRVQIPPPPPYEPSSSSYTPSSSYAPSSSTSAYPPSSAYTPSSSTSTLPSYAPSPATFRAVPLPSPYTLPTADAFAPSFVPPQFAPQQPYASPAQLGPQPYVSAAHFGGAGGPMVSVASEEKKHCCPHCLKRFNRPSSLSIHVNTHTGAKRESCLPPRFFRCARPCVTVVPRRQRSSVPSPAAAAPST